MAEGKGFEMKISQTGGEEIYIDTNGISSVEFKIDTIDENVKDRSEDIVNSVTVTGKIVKENKAATKDLLLWSLADKSEEIYRSAEIIIRINKTERVRKYTLNKVFCLDYTETLHNGSADSTFELKFAQRKDNFDGIEVLC